MPLWSTRETAGYPVVHSTTTDLFWGPFAEQINSANREEIGRTGSENPAFLSVLSAQITGAHFLPPVQLAKQMKAPVLYLGSCADTVLASLAEEGSNVSCITFAPDAMEAMRQRLAILPQNVQARIDLRQRDLANFQLDEKFPLVILPYFTLGLLAGHEERRALLRQAALHLAPEGVLAFEYPDFGTPHSPAGMIKETELHVDGRAAKAKVGWKLSDDSRSLVVNSSMSLVQEDGTTQLFLEAAQVQLIGPKEAEQLLAENDLVISERHPSATDITHDLWYCRRRSDVSYPLWHPFMPMKGMEDLVTILVEGKGCKVRNKNGKEYIDASGGLWNTNCGLGNPEIIQAITEELHRLSYATLFAWRGNEPALELARELVAMAPSPLQWAYLTGSGSEAVELSIKLARLFSRLQGKKGREIVYLDESYHGTFFGSMSLSGITQMREAVGPMLPGLASIASPNSLRCPPDTSYVEFALSCAQGLEERAATGNVAAFIIEPILGSAGVVIPPREYFQRIESICRKHNILLILDEVASGMGRTGKWFAAEHYDLHPDILLLSKGMNSGYLPIGAVLFSAEIGSALMDRGLGVFHGSTYNGHPACCAAALATLKVMRKEQLLERAAEVGLYFRDRLLELQKDIPFIKEVRAAGLMLGVVLAQEDGSLSNQAQVLHVFRQLLERGVMAYMGLSALVFCPPYIISHEEIDTVVGQLGLALKSTRLRDGGVE
jgi:adenosylmethionine-8-amino-7-oxononanoate aminotransferase